MRISDWSSDVCSSDLRRRRWRGSSASAAFQRPFPFRHVELVPASKYPRALAPEAHWTPEQVRGDGIWLTSSTSPRPPAARPGVAWRSEEHTSELQSLMRISYAVFCLKKKTKMTQQITLKRQPKY